jgi:NTP pyrophosphatase (non-canonical NTP hydrolase)
MATILELTSEIVRFRDEREWKKYHTPRNLALSIVIELGELFEHFQWKEDEEILELTRDPIKKEKIEEEIAYVAIYLFLLSYELGINLENAILDKIRKNKEKYPVDEVRGVYRKYTELVRNDE